MQGNPVTDPVALFHLASEAFDRGLVDEAELILAQIPKYAADIETLPEYRILMARILFRIGQQSLSIEILEKLNNEAPNRHDVIRTLGDIYCQSGDLKKAAYYLNRSRKIEKYANRKDVYVFGDSHADFLFSGIARCRVYSMGPMTMHRVGRDGLDAVDVVRYEVPDNTHVVLVFGEIDLRSHVLRQRDERGRDLDEIIETLCTRYMQTAFLNKLRLRGGKLVVLSVVPPTVSPENPDFPFIGPIGDRIGATKLVNTRLAELCALNDIVYLDMHKYFCSRNGLLLRSISDGIVHVRREYSDIVEYELERCLDL